MTRRARDEGCGGTQYAVDDCTVQYPASDSVQTNEAFTGYVRVYAAGLTDLSGGNDPASELIVQLGYGLDGSDPSGLAPAWAWQSAAPNGAYGPGAPAYDANRDEYLASVAIAGAGIYDLAGRVSGDGGDTWVYCDLDGLTTGGYTSAQAGHVEVGQ